MPNDKDPKLEPEGVPEEKKEESFSFLQETIKPKPISREKVFTQFVRIGIYGLIFGMFACFSFFALKPWAEEAFRQEADKVTIPEDEEQNPEEEQTEEEMPVVVPALTVDNYREMMRSLYDVAKEADKSVVSVRAWKEADWMDDSSNKRSVTGLIAADNGRNVLIFSDDSVCREASEWSVTFADGKEYPASLIKKDENRGLAVFGVERNLLSNSTWNSIQVAVLGNSNTASRGDPVIALGNMFGYDGGLGYGVISSKVYDEIFADGRFDVIATDIAAVSDGTGVLVNQNGEVLGLIKEEIWEETESHTVNALAISDLKSVLEMMLNGESVPYIGIYGIGVSEETSEQQEIPEGVYVTQVETDSPAMAAGIQNGDVIQEVAGITVTGTTSYANAVLHCDVGDEIRVKGQRRGAGGYVDVNFTVAVGSKE